MTATTDRFLVPFFVCALCALGAGTVSAAEELTWRTEPADAFWNASSLNWGTGVVWQDGIKAIFGDSTQKNITVEGDVSVSDMTFSADGYALGGEGRLVLPDTDVATAYTWSVPRNCTATIGNVITNARECVLVKQDEGTLRLTGDVRVMRLHGGKGTLSLAGARVEAAKIRASFADVASTLHVDGATIVNMKSNNGILIGDTAPFATAQLGADGMNLQLPFDAIFNQSFGTAPDVETDGGIVKSGEGVLTFERDNTFNGGIRVLGSQVRAKTNRGFGTGPVSLEGDKTSLFVFNDLWLENRINVGKETYIGGLGGADDRPTLTNVGVLESNTEKALYLGRANNAFSRVRLALNETSDSFAKVYLRGALDLAIDGGVVKATADAASPFFDTTQFAPSAEAVAQVGQGGFTFDTNGADTELGVRLDLSNALVTNVAVSTTAFPNGDFETGGAATGTPQGWKLTTTTTGETNSGRQPNSSGFTSTNPEYQTSNGDYYVALRRNSTFSTTITVPEDGDWRVAMDLGCRPDSNYQTHKISVAIAIDDETVYELGPRAEKHPFTTFRSGFIPLSAGTHTFVLTTDRGSTVSYDSLLVDQFRLERLVDIEPPVVEKRGAGTLGVQALATQGRVNVNAGTLFVQEPAFESARVAVDAGAMLALAGGTLAGSAVSVAAGATVSFRSQGTDNAVKNGSFEAVQIKEKTFQSGATDWTFEKMVEDKDLAASGIQANGSAMSVKDANNSANTTTPPLTAAGTQTAFLRYGSRMSQTIAVPAAGTYRLAFLTAPRDYGDSHKLTLTVSLGDANVTTIGPQEASRAEANYAFQRTECLVELAAGETVLAFETSNTKGSGQMMLIDDVRLERVYGAPVTTGTTWSLASGSTVDLRLGETLLLDAVTVDGKKVTGTRAALESAGVTVTGSGNVQIGPASGTLFLLR